MSPLKLLLALSSSIAITGTLWISWLYFLTFLEVLIFISMQGKKDPNHIPELRHQKAMGIISYWGNANKNHLSDIPLPAH